MTAYLEDLNLSSENEQLTLADIYAAITDRSFLVMLTADTEQIAIDMFESLNNTGKDLEKYYVLKNNIVKVLGEGRVKESWKEIDANLLDLSPNSFLIATATILDGKTSRSQVLPHIYSKFKSGSVDSMNKLLILLNKAAKAYLLISRPQLYHKNSKKRTIQQYQELSELLSSFKMKQHFPIILGLMLKDIPLQQINSVLRAVLTVAIRNFYFGEQKANTLETAFARYAKQIYNGDITVDILVRQIYSFAIGDDETIQNIITKNVGQNGPVRAILRTIYNSELKNDDVKVNSTNIDVEHILPLKPKAKGQWDKWFPNDRREKYQHSIGNLTLWIDHRNRTLKNAEFSEKRESYKESSLSANREIAENDQWTPSQIDNRSNKLAQMIVEYFSIPTNEDDK